MAAPQSVQLGPGWSWSLTKLTLPISAEHIVSGDWAASCESTEPAGVDFLPSRQGSFPESIGNYSLAHFCNTSKDRSLGKRVSL